LVNYQTQSSGKVLEDKYANPWQVNVTIELLHTASERQELTLRSEH